MVDDQAFRTDERVISLLDRMSQVLDAEEGRLNDFVSVRGLYVSHHAAPVRFTPEELEGIPTDPTAYRWPTNAINMDNPEDVEREIPARTFAEALGQSFASTWNDPDRMMAFDTGCSGLGRSSHSCSRRRSSGRFAGDHKLLVVAEPVDAVAVL